MLGEKIRHTRRYREIVNVFMKNGFSHILFRIGLADRGLSKENESAEMNKNMKSVGKQLRHALEDLGPTFIKLGQMASTRHDALPSEITDELEKLQDHAAVLPYEHVRNTIEAELDEELDKLFAYVDTEPLATASIGQVHNARLLTGKDVVVKVQRPGLKPIMETDLEILHGIGRLLEEKTDWASRYRLCDIIEELSNSLRNELDYVMEGRNSERIARQFERQNFIKVPTVYWKYTSKLVMTMEKIDGIKASNIEMLDEEGYDRKIIAKRLADSMMRQILEYGYFHADPHSGNIFILPDNTIAYMDFGEAGAVSEQLKRHFASIIVNLHRGDTKAMIRTFSRMELIGEETNLEALGRDLDELHANYENANMNDQSLGRVIIGIFNVVYHHQIKMPSEIVIIAKTILTLEGVLGRLDPEFSLMRAAEPFAKTLVRKQYHPREIFRNSLEQIGENIEVLSDLPKNLKEVMDVVKQGKIGLDINVKRGESIMRRLDKISNRLTFSILMLAFSILMASLIIGFAIVGQDTIIWDLPIIEIGAVVAALMFILMVITIIRSGRM